jgi:hypothetical protein
MKLVAQALSKLLLVTGALIFFFGDRALREFYKVPFLTSLLAGIGSGVAVMFAGAAIKLAISKPENKESGTRSA